MTIKDIMDVSGMSRKQLSARFGIPKLTVDSWVRGDRRPPEYVLTMLAYIIMLEKGADNAASSEELGSRISESSEGSAEACEKSKSKNVKTRKSCGE